MVANQKSTPQQQKVGERARKKDLQTAANHAHQNLIRERGGGEGGGKSKLTDRKEPFQKTGEKKNQSNKVF